MKEYRKRHGGALAVYALITSITSAILLGISILLVVKMNSSTEEITNEESKIASLTEDVAELKQENEELSDDNYDLEKRNQRLTESSTSSSFRNKLKEMAIGGRSTVQILKYFFPEQLIVTDEGNFFFYDIDDSLNKSGLRDEGFAYDKDSGKVSYNFENSETFYGIDVSKYNQQIDWKAAADSGIEFAYIRCGIRGYGSGKIVEDELFKSNVEGALEAGINVGPYFFTQAVNEEEAVEEARFVLDMIQGMDIACPVAYDLEKVEDGESAPRTAGISQEQFTKNTIAFCKTIEEAGYEPIIYGNLKTFIMMLDMKQLEDYQKWFAGYVTDEVFVPYFPYKFRIWQFSSKGSVAGVTGPCDLDLAFY